MSSEAGVPILVVKDVRKTFGGLHALDGVSLTVNKGDVLGLIGPNGSGKTTLINTISGLIMPDGGHVAFEGRDLTRKSPDKRVHAGINRTYQVPSPFHKLTVWENMVVAATYGRAKDVDIEKLLRRAGLDAFRDREAGSLNSSQQKLLDIARALATAPKLMLVDEIAAGLNPKELSWLAEWLLELSAAGIALLVVEHLIPFLQLVTTRVVVMDVGSVIFEGDIASATQDDHVIEVFLGRGK